MAESAIKTEKYTLEEIDIAAEDVLLSCEIDVNRVGCLLETIEKVMHHGILLENCVKEGFVTEQEMKPLLGAMQSVLDKNRSEGIKIEQQNTMRKKKIDDEATKEPGTIAESKDAEKNDSPSVNIAKKPPPKITQPSHWKEHATILDQVIDDSIKSYRVPDKRGSLRKGVAEILLNGKTAGEVIRESDEVGSTSLLRYARHAFDNAAAVLGLEEADQDPDVKSALLTPPIAYDALKKIIASKQPEAQFSPNVTLPSKMGTSSVSTRRASKRPTHPSEAGFETPKIARLKNSSRERVADRLSLTLSALDKVSKRDVQVVAKKKFSGTGKDLHAVVEDRLCGRYENVKPLVELVTSVIELDCKLRKSNITLEQLVAAYEFCSVTENLEDAEVAGQKSDYQNK
uniref:Uncharacterized protein n=1 Tax=Ditylenchus dipsaci TaxID=166011 RepID=A0A915DZL6_9BILA